MLSTPKRKATAATELPKSPKRPRAGASLIENIQRTRHEGEEPSEDAQIDIKKSRTRKINQDVALTLIQVDVPINQAALESTKSESTSKPSLKRPRKSQTKEAIEAAKMPLAPRTPNLRMFVGAHVSVAKGVHNAINNATHIGGNALALFLKSQRKWENPPLLDEQCEMFHARCAEHGIDAAQHVLPHGSYLVNLAQADQAKAKQAYDVFLDDLQRCERLGIRLYNFHPGNTNSKPRPEAIGRIADAINRAHKLTKHVKPVLENMAGSGNVIGTTFEDLRDIIALVDDKARIGVCLDTCHTFAAGYDLRSMAAFRSTLAAFDSIIGGSFLSALHVNDSKTPFASHRDLHQNIGLGFLGLRAFHHIMNEARFESLPLVLETPVEVRHDDGFVSDDHGIRASEIKLLESLIGMDVESGEFKALEADLAAQGAVERAKFQEQADRQMAKGESKARKPK